MGLTESKSSSRKMRLKTVDFPRIDKDTACNTAFGEGASSLRSTGIHSQASQSSRYPPIVPPRSSSFSGGAHSNGGKASSRHQSMTDSPPAEKKGTIRSCLQWDSRSSQASTSHSSQSSRPAIPSPQGQGKYPKGTCDKCDGGHLTDDCPIYKKKRDDHPDAWRNFGKKNPLEMGKGGGNFRLRSARVVRQPGDGSCLFHSLAYGLGGASASGLRRDIAAFIQRNPDLEIAETPMKDWVKWDSGCSVSQYASRMGVSGWGGGIEMAACSHLKRVNVHVYEKERLGGGYKRISCFDVDGAGKTVHVLYCGGVHFDALVP